MNDPVNYDDSVNCQRLDNIARLLGCHRDETVKAVAGLLGDQIASEAKSVASIPGRDLSTLKTMAEDADKWGPHPDHEVRVIREEDNTVMGMIFGPTSLEECLHYLPPKIPAGHYAALFYLPANRVIRRWHPVDGWDG